MTTKLEKRCIDAIVEWCHKHNRPSLTRPRHVYPRCYVIGRWGDNQVLVALPWQDSEPQVMDFSRTHNVKMVDSFDKSLRVGDWCTVAYVVSVGRSDNVAIKAVIPA